MRKPRGRGGSEGGGALGLEAADEVGGGEGAVDGHVDVDRRGRRGQAPPTDRADCGRGGGGCWAEGRAMVSPDREKRKVENVRDRYPIPSAVREKHDDDKDPRAGGTQSAARFAVGLRARMPDGEGRARPAAAATPSSFATPPLQGWVLPQGGQGPAGGEHGGCLRRTNALRTNIVCLRFHLMFR